MFTISGVEDVNLNTIAVFKNVLYQQLLLMVPKNGSILVKYCDEDSNNSINVYSMPPDIWKVCNIERGTDDELKVCLKKKESGKKESGYVTYKTVLLKEIKFIETMIEIYESIVENNKVNDNG